MPSRASPLSNSPAVHLPPNKHLAVCTPPHSNKLTSLPLSNNNDYFHAPISTTCQDPCVRRALRMMLFRALQRTQRGRLALSVWPRKSRSSCGDYGITSSLHSSELPPVPTGSTCSPAQECCFLCLECQPPQHHHSPPNSSSFEFSAPISLPLNKLGLSLPSTYTTRALHVSLYLYLFNVCTAHRGPHLTSRVPVPGTRTAGCLMPSARHAGGLWTSDEGMNGRGLKQGR